MVQINSGYVVIDNAWLWRADHGIAGETYNEDNPVRTGLEVNGDNVIAYGLASEHTLGNLVEWNGNYGATYFYQSELPYDATTDYGSSGFAGYHVSNNASSHEAWGVGVYCFFRDHPVHVSSGITAPESAYFKNAMTVFLTGQGGINHVINAKGKGVYKSGQQSYVC